MHISRRLDDPKGTLCHIVTYSMRFTADFNLHIAVLWDDIASAPGSQAPDIHAGDAVEMAGDCI
ncbi:Uncharacterised protein [Mycobacteroides abscessus subsp. abscessus]|nr:Uncharacterised protein [Mycobacteroides abscessus subsp. abscessus]